MSIRFLVAAPLLLIITSSTAPAAEGQLDANQTLFAAMAALNATGYDAGVNSCIKEPLRVQLRQVLASRNIPSLPEMKRFIGARRRRDSVAELQQYISFALSAKGPPDFEWKVDRDEIPPDAIQLDGFGPLLARFYREAGLDDLWRASQPAIEKALASYQQPLSEALLQVNAYLRNPTSGYVGRSFQVYVELLAEPNQTATRSYAEEYFVVLTPALEVQTDYIRHAYLHYLLDPLSSKYREKWDRVRGLGDFAQASPLLEDSYKTDFLLLATESLIKVIEARLGSASTRAGLIDEAFRQGFVLAPYFAEVLPAYEKQQQSMRLFYLDMITGIDARKEEARLDSVQWATVRAAKPVKACASEPAPVVSGIQKLIEDAEDLYNKRQLEPAKENFRKVLEGTTERKLHARAYYGLARIAALERDPELAEKLLHKTLELEPEPAVKAWTFVYLGRLAANHVDGIREDAARYFEAALAVDGASALARQAAEQGIKQSSRKSPDKE